VYACACNSNITVNVESRIYLTVFNWLCIKIATNILITTWLVNDWTNRNRIDLYVNKIWCDRWQIRRFYCRQFPKTVWFTYATNNFVEYFHNVMTTQARWIFRTIVFGSVWYCIRSKLKYFSCMNYVMTDLRMAG
jgi:hypothetical protein